jgi:hypothetical protein
MNAIDEDVLYDRLKDVMEVETFKQMARVLKIDNNTFNTMRYRGTIPFKAIILYALKNNVDINALFKPTQTRVEP